MTPKAVTCCFRIFVISLTVLIWLIGGAVFGFCLWLRLDYSINQYIGASDELEKSFVILYIFLVAGLVILLFCILGIYAAARPDRLCLIVYEVFLAVLLALLIGGGTYAYVYRQEIIDSFKNWNTLSNIVKSKYGIDGRVTDAMDLMQYELKCCGGTSYTDYLESSWQLSDPLHVEYRRYKAPLSCCKDYYRYKDTPYQYCTIYKTDPDTSGNQLPDLSDGLNKRGCADALVQYLRDNIAIPAGIAFGIVALVVLTGALVIVLIIRLRKAPVPQQDDVVYEMARTQEKSPYPTRGGPYANLYQS